MDIDFYHRTRSEFPELTAMADREHVRVWGEVDEDTAFCWFESLAKALNQEMRNGVPSKGYNHLFRYFNDQYREGCNKVKECIDVSFIENLFWDVPSSKCETYWRDLPADLKDLYIEFHGKRPL